MTALTPHQVNDFVAETYPDAAAQGFRCVELGPGQALCRWRHDPASLRPGGLISGPTQFAAADIALWFLSFTVLGLAAMAVTSDIHIVFLRPARGGDLLSRAELLRAGKSRISGRVLSWVDGDRDRPVSHATGSYARLA
jgi:acyl-coenzyme A thioesterase PaaI-like protein